MSTFYRVFRKSRVLLAVNHIESVDQALENTRVAFGEGADGVFLINHSISSGKLREVYYEVRKEVPGGWLGLNFLSTPLMRLIGGILPDDADGFWTDNAGYQPAANDAVFLPRTLDELRKKRNGPVNHQLYFGGISFKGQHDTADIPAACKAATECQPFVDVITTSGTKTGVPPELDKIEAMHEVLAGHPLAIASGLSPDNVEPYLRFTSAILCATGMSHSFTRFDPIKVRNMARLVHGS